MEQWTLEELEKYCAYLMRVRLDIKEKTRLLDLYLPHMSPELASEIRTAAPAVLAMDRAQLADEFFRSEQFEIGTEGRNVLLAARFRALSESSSRNADPPRESRARLINPVTLGQKYDKALLDYARGDSAAAEDALAELAEKYFCLEAAENLLAYYAMYGDNGRGEGIFRLYRAIYRHWLRMSMPEWCADFEKVYAGCEDSPLPSYRPYDPEEPLQARGHLGFS